MRHKNENIFVRITRNGYIPQLGICGPIPNPIKITRQTAYAMVSSGIDVYQVDPVTKNTTKLTLQSVFGDVPSQEVTKAEEAPVVTKKVEEPTAPVELTGVTKEVEETTVEPVVESEETSEKSSTEKTVEEVVAETNTNSNKKNKKNKNK